MTNFQAGAGRRLSREQVLRGGPVLLGALLAGAACLMHLGPALQLLQSDQEQLDLLRQQQERLPLLRQRLEQLRASLDLAESRQRQLLDLISGSGDISTFMAQLDLEARRSGVQLDSYEPLSGAATGAAGDATAPATANPNAAPDPNANANANAAGATPAPAAPAPAAPPPAAPAAAPATPAAAPDPLMAPGLHKVTLLITARGRGDQLRDFLRRLERLRLLVVQSDLSIKADSSSPARPSTLRLTLALYSRGRS